MESTTIGCCMEPNRYHRHCEKSINTALECGPICTTTPGCKGYFTLTLPIFENGTESTCAVITESECPDGFYGPYYGDNTGDIMLDTTCRPSGIGFSPCYLKPPKSKRKFIAAIKF